MTESQKFGYVLGIDVANSMKGLPLEWDIDSFCEAFKTVIDGGELKLSQQELHGALSALQAKIQEAQAKETEVAASKNLEDGQEFLADNSTKDGVLETATGLQYMVIEEGEGVSPTSSDVVTVHYTGKLIDGTVFDSSVQRGTPATFPVNGVIAGWTEALQMMKVGAKWRLFIPSDLAYGERGAGQTIGPNSVLVFDVELLDVQNS